MPINVSPSIPTESSTAAPGGKFSDWFKGIGDWLKSLSPAGATQYDTDWISLAPEAGFTGSAWYRRIGKTVHLDIGTTTRTSGTGNATMYILPAGFTPVRQYSGAYMQITTGTANPGHSVWISTSGQVRAGFVAGVPYTGYAVFAVA